MIHTITSTCVCRYEYRLIGIPRVLMLHTLKRGESPIVDENESLIPFVFSFRDGKMISAFGINNRLNGLLFDLEITI